jgi:hypothetical protein
MNPLRAMLPEEWQSPHFIDDEAAMRSFLDAVEDLAKVAVAAACALDRANPMGPHDLANELHGSAAYVRPGVEDA